ARHYRCLLQLTPQLQYHTLNDLCSYRHTLYDHRDHQDVDGPIQRNKYSCAKKSPEERDSQKNPRDGPRDPGEEMKDSPESKTCLHNDIGNQRIKEHADHRTAQRYYESIP